MLQKIYDFCKKPNFNLTQFYSDHRDLIDNTPFVPVDIEKLKENCHDTYDPEKHKYETCVICFSEFEKGDKILELPVCGHIYHTQCLTPWLEKKNNCAICKGKIRYNLFMMIKQGLGKTNLTKSDLEK